MGDLRRALTCLGGGEVRIDEGTVRYGESLGTRPQTEYPYLSKFIVFLF